MKQFEIAARLHLQEKLIDVKQVDLPDDGKPKEVEDKHYDEEKDMAILAHRRKIIGEEKRLMEEMKRQ
jgi:hypothetical protein